MMFTKILFLVVLGCALSFATPAKQVDQELRVKREAGDKVKEWWENVTAKINNWFGDVKTSLQDFWDRITGKAASRERQEKLNQLKKEFEALTEASRQSIQNKKEEWDRIIKENEERLEQIKQEAEKDIDSEINRCDKEFNEFKQYAEAIIASLD